MDLRKSVNSQMRINKSKILEYNSKEVKSLTYDFTPILIISSDEDTSFIDTSTSVEVKIPSIMISIMININVDEYIFEETYLPSKYESLIMTLYLISKNLKDIKVKSKYSKSFWNNTCMDLLGLINEYKLSSEDFRNDIYEELGVISSYIKYSNVNEYEFY